MFLSLSNSQRSDELVRAIQNGDPAAKKAFEQWYGFDMTASHLDRPNEPAQASGHHRHRRLTGATHIELSHRRMASMAQEEPANITPTTQMTPTTSPSYN